jgi:DNA-binding MarR family transcriptional regulator
MRAVLEFLEVSGPTPVPAIARRRRVTRQHIQVIVNGLLKHGLVITRQNPAHQRSTLIALTGEGRAMMQEIRRREEAFLGSANFGLSPGDLKRARKTLRAVRRGLEERGAT